MKSRGSIEEESGGSCKGSEGHAGPAHRFLHAPALGVISSCFVYPPHKHPDHLHIMW
jgi:hypothetical protein